MKNNLHGMKKHRSLLSFISAASAFMLFVCSFSAAAFASDTGGESADSCHRFALCISDALLKKDNVTAENTGVIEPEIPFEEDVSAEITINDTSAEIETRDNAGETLVNLADFLVLCRPTCTVSSGACFGAEDNGLFLDVNLETNCIIANGRYLWCNGGIISDGGKIFVPASVAARVVCGESVTNGKKISITLDDGCKYIESGESFYNSEDVYWLSRIICAESRGEVLEGKIAVGNVVLNRVLSDSYPDTVYDVIFDSKAGVQFSPTLDGTIYCEPSQESIIAAKLCLEGVSVSNEILYFLNPTTAENLWITNNRTYITTIGNHAFYS